MKNVYFSFLGSSEHVLLPGDINVDHVRPFETEAPLFVSFRTERSISFVTCRCRLLASPGLVLPPASSGPLPPSSPAPYSSPALFPRAAFFHPAALCTWRGRTQNSSNKNDFRWKHTFFCLSHIILK